MSHSWRSGCPVPLQDLRWVRLTHLTFDGGTTTGELIVHKDVVRAFARGGWKWGGFWTRGTLDYQHFSVSGR